jgi:tetratricopeptide (TPR) repeat protein
VFAVQDEIAAAITNALHVTLSAGAPARGHRPTLPAYEHYLKGLYHAQRPGPESNALARNHFERAIELDPAFALAHAAIGHLLHQLAVYGFMPPRQALPLVQEQARRALAIDPSLPEAHAVMGAATAMFDYNWAEAERHFRLAMAQDAIPPLVHMTYAMYCLLPTGRAPDAVRHMTLALNEDPLNLGARGERAVCLRAAGRIEEGDAELREVLELEKSFPFPYFMLGVNMALAGRFDEASVLAERAYALAPWFKAIVGLRAAMLVRAGEAARAAETLEQLRPQDGYVDPIGPAVYHLLSGDLEATADWIEKAIEQRQPAVFFFLNAHATALRSSPRWPALARMINLPSQ